MNFLIANIFFGITFVGFFLPLLYLFIWFLSGKRIHYDMSNLIMYMGTTFFFAVIFEINIDKLYTKIFTVPLWEYRIWTLHNNYTSGIGMLMWPLYGFYIYGIHYVLKKSNIKIFDNDYFKGIIIGIDAMILEALANTFSLVFYNTFYFYYLPGDLFHFTTIQVFLPYVFCGTIGVKILKLLEHQKQRHVHIGLLFYFSGLLILFN